MIAKLANIALEATKALQIPNGKLHPLPVWLHSRLAASPDLVLLCSLSPPFAFSHCPDGFLGSVQCELGKYAPQALSGACLECGAGSRTETIVGATSCTQCDAGEFSLGGVSECQTCPAGSYSPSGSDECIKCDPEFYAESAGSSVCSLCIAGFSKGFTSGAGASSCDKCLDGFVWIYNEKTETTGCVECGEKGALNGADCPLVGTTVDTITLKFGYWRTSASSDDIRKCRQPEFCVGGDDSEDYCEIGHTGPYCAVCLANYYPSVLGNCSECQDGTTQGYLMVGGIGLSIILIIAAVVKMKPHKRISETSYKRLKNLAKILFVFLQILCSVPVLFGVLFPNPFRNFLNVLGIPALTLPVATVMGCLFVSDYYMQLLVATLFPLAVNALVFLVYVAIVALRMRRAQVDKINTEVRIQAMTATKGPSPDLRLFNTCVAISLLVVYVFLPAASRIIFGAFYCEPFDDGGRFLASDYSIDCREEKYKTMRIFAILMTCIWPVGVPLMFGVILFMNRTRLISDAVGELLFLPTQLREEYGSIAYIEEEILSIRDADFSLDGIRLLFDTYRPMHWHVVAALLIFLLQINAACNLSLNDIILFIFIYFARSPP